MSKHPVRSSFGLSEALATAAVFGNHETAILHRWLQLWTVTTGHTQKLNEYVLPVYYHTLSAKIPTADQFDSMLIGNKTNFGWIDPILISFDVLPAISDQIPQNAFSALWRRVLSWVTFIDTYRDFFSAIVSKLDIYSSFITLLNKFCRHNKTASLIYPTPGVHSLIARTWVTAVDTLQLCMRRGIPHQDLLLIPVVQALKDALLRQVQNWDRHHATEFVRSVGGHAQFTAVVVRHIQCVLVGPYDLDDIYFVGSTLVFVSGSDEFFVKTVQASDKHDIVVLLIRLLHSLTISTSEHTETLMQICVRFIYHAITLVSEDAELVLDALRAGLILAMVSYVCKAEAASPALEQVSNLFKAILPQASVHRLSLIKTGSLKRYHFAKPPSWFECDNSKCAKIDIKRKLRRCSNCNLFYYCSKECQTADWKDGGHRASCQPQRQHRINFLFPFPTRDLSFLRLLVHDIFEQTKVNTLLAQVEFLRTWPNSYVVNVVDFNHYPSTIQIKGYGEGGSDVRNLTDEDVSGYLYALRERARRGDGRLQLFAMRLCPTPAGVVSQHVFTLRSSDSVLFKGVRRIARETPAGISKDSLRRRVEELIAATKHSRTFIQ
ncbi:hypothetical protein R3P38DRAFT_3207624 [Favolaschia claudopus]|uniref:MYND-type domain-containing protein n=1 Tax=Favolaschia claudopus TaxID=2862362 RepID=A0AAW0AIQ9_9AGAR